MLGAVLLILFFGVEAEAQSNNLFLKLDIKASFEDVICLQCHPNVTNNSMNYVHYPAAVGACSYCHIARPDHLNGDNAPGSVTINRQAENCYVCHERNDDNKIKHGALNNPESCVRCHNPHGSYARFLLQSDSIPTLCSTCHNVSMMGKSRHGPAINGKACMNCHFPHSGTEEKLLRKPSRELCLSCHNKEIKATLNDSRTIANIQQKLSMSHPHPGALGSCLTCHTSHASMNYRLLKNPWSVTIYNTYSEVNNPYAVCFTCHQTSMMGPRDFVTRTQFRDDHTKLNLHWFHVVDAAGSEDKSRGRSCKICHDPHGAAQPHDINTSWFMNGTPVTLEYQLIEKGGQCTKSCHSLRAYRRI
ncbi:MAG: cytochrome c3 family protein [Bdellovibrionota bacterium]